VPEFRIDVVIDPKTRPGARRVEGDLKRIEKRSSAVRSNLTRMLTLLGGGALITKSIRTIAQFEQTMSTVQAVTKATGAEFDLLTQKAKDLGISTRFTATEAAQGLVELSRAGLTTDEALASVGDTLLLAQAGELGLAEAAKITTTAMKVFNLEASETARIADDLVIVANSTKTNVSEMGQAFTFVAANAADLNISVEETAALLGSLANGGLTATRGGTALRAVLLGLAAPSKEAADILEDLDGGIEQFDIGVRGIVPVLESLAEAELDVEQKTAIFGKRFGAAGSILLKNIPLVEELVKLQGLLAGESKRVADIMDDNLNGALLKLKSAFEGLILDIGSGGASGAFRNLFDTLSQGLRNLAANADKVIDTLEFLFILLTVKLAKRAIPAVIGALQSLYVAILANPWGALATAIVIAGAALVAFGEDLPFASDGLATFGDAAAVTVDIIKQGFGEMGTAVSDFIATMALLVPSLEGVEVSFFGVLRFLAGGFDNLVGIFRGVGRAAVAIFGGIGPALGEGFTNGINNILRDVETFIDNIRATFGGIFDFLAKGWANTIEIAEQYLIIAKNVAIGKGGETNQAFFETIDRLKAEQDPANLGASILSRKAKLDAEQTIPLLENAYAGAGVKLGTAIREGILTGLEDQQEGGFAARLDTFRELVEQRAQIAAQQVEDERVLTEAKQAAIEASKALVTELEKEAEAQEKTGKSTTKALTTFEKYIKELQAEASLLGMTASQREIANEVLALENKLREENIELTAAQREQVNVELERLQVLQLQAEILDEIRGPQEDLNNRQEALNALMQGGKITVDEYNSALRDLAKQSAQTAGVMGSTVQPGLETIGQQLFGIGEFTKQTLGVVFSNLEEALVSFAQTGEISFSKLVDSMLQDIARLLVQQGLQLLLGALSGGIGGAAGGLLSGVLGGGGGGGAPQYVGGGSYGGGGGGGVSIPAAAPAPSLGGG